MKEARERAAIERTLREEQDANDSGFKSALEAGRAVDPMPFPSFDSAKCLGAVDWAARPPHMHPRCERPRWGAAAARRPRRLEVRPGVVPDVLERVVSGARGGTVKLTD